MRETSERAWLQRAEDLVDDDDPLEVVKALAGGPGDRLMTLELGAVAESLAGSFADLVAIGSEAGVQEFYVWSQSGATS